MNNIESFQTILEILLLVLTLSSQSPWLGIAAAIGALLCLFTEDKSDNGGNG